MGVVTEIGPDLYRISIYVPQFDLQFNHFLIRDEEPLLYHAGLRGMFPLLRDARDDTGPGSPALDFVQPL